MREGDVALLSDPAFLTELIAWLCFNDAAVLQTGDGLASKVAGQPASLDWPARVIIRYLSCSASEYSALAYRQPGRFPFLIPRSDRTKLPLVGVAVVAKPPARLPASVAIQRPSGRTGMACSRLTGLRRLRMRGPGTQTL